MGKSKIQGMMTRAHANAIRQGLWDDERDGIAGAVVVPSAQGNLSRLMLVVTAVAGAAEAVRKDNVDKFGEELVEICIRVFDLAQATNIDLETAIAAKLKFEEMRAKMHGKTA